MLLKNQCSAIIYGLCSKTVDILPLLAQTFFTVSGQMPSETSESSHQTSNFHIISYISSLCPLMDFFLKNVVSPARTLRQQQVSLKIEVDKAWTDYTVSNKSLLAEGRS